ncbi:DNA-binding transcriptional LysR family regulator [Paralcaligenes ureilyticus]|uniref:DNA-binding transcriptional LysR family regulator n=2 Tax=Paralcaligenes ureilyticus TaxID=627131 RepID=A0A4R3MC87_9BURK|nr:DNA-binding transcriptional LysR family regulator [Paralcaligenes ureilyticus]
MVERNVTRAADRVEISQSSASKDLTQLRILFGDPLFLRTRRGVVPTHKALEVAEDVRRAIQALNNLSKARGEFEPQTAQVEFNIGATDYVSFVLLPKLLEKLTSSAPSTRITIHDIDQLPAEEMLLSSKVDLVLSSAASVSFPLYRQELFRDNYVCVSRKNHPAIKKNFTLAQFLACRHLGMPGQNGGRERVLPDVMRQMELSRDVAIYLPHLLSVPPMLIATNLVMMLASRVAEAFAAAYPIKIYKHPLRLGDFGVYQLWHERTHRSQSHQWLRALIKSTSDET